MWCHWFILIFLNIQFIPSMHRDIVTIVYVYFVFVFAVDVNPKAIPFLSGVCTVSDATPNMEIGIVFMFSDIVVAELRE